MKKNPGVFIPGFRSGIFVKVTFALMFLICLASAAYSQKFSKTLLQADKLYINKAYEKAAGYYGKYLIRNPKDFYASRQAALCYDRVNNPNMAIDYWPAVIESSQASEHDNLAYAKCLLANYRMDEARRVFLQLSRSADKTVADWGKAYMNTAGFFHDSALCKVYEVKGINTQAREYAPVLCADKLFFISDPLKNQGSFDAVTDKEVLIIHTASRTDSMAFHSGPLFHAPKARNINGSFCFSADQSLLYFSTAVSAKDLWVKGKGSFYRFQLYIVPASGSDISVPFKYNSPFCDILHPCLSKDGNRLYFASNMPGSLGGKDIFVCELINGEWGSPRNLGPEVNTSGNELFPYITEEGVLYFASDTRPGLGGLDLFSAKPSTQAKLFESAQNLGSPMNTQFDDFSVFLMPGGKTGYLSSNRKNNMDEDIFYFRNSKP